MKKKCVQVIAVFSKIGNWIRNFMMGRYGSDQLNLALLGLGIVMILLGTFLGRAFAWASLFNILCYIPLLLCIFRMYSRNIAARRRENQAFLGFFQRIKDREHRYFRCPRCGQVVRVPRGRGKINIRCPKCSEQFVRNS